MFVSTPDALTLYNLFRCVQVVAEEPTLAFSGEGLTVVEMDPSHVAMVVAYAPKKLFDNWEIYSNPLDWLLSNGQPTKISVNMKDVVNYLKVKKNSYMEISNEDEKVKFTVDDVVVRLPKLKIKDYDIPKPNVELEAKIVMDIKPILDVIENWHRIKGKWYVPDIIFETTDEGDFKLSMNESDATFERVFKKTDPHILEITHTLPQKAMYSIGWIKDMLKTAKKLSNLIVIQFSTEKPVRLSALNQVQVDYWLAPRIP